MKNKTQFRPEKNPFKVTTASGIDEDFGSLVEGLWYFDTLYYNSATDYGNICLWYDTGSEWACVINSEYSSKHAVADFVYCSPSEHLDENEIEWQEFSFICGLALDKESNYKRGFVYESRDSAWNDYYVKACINAGCEPEPDEDLKQNTIRLMLYKKKAHKLSGWYYKLFREYELEL